MAPHACCCSQRIAQFLALNNFLEESYHHDPSHFACPPPVRAACLRPLAATPACSLRPSAALHCRRHNRTPRASSLRLIEHRWIALPVGRRRARPRRGVARSCCSTATWCAQHTLPMPMRHPPIRPSIRSGRKGTQTSVQATQTRHAVCVAQGVLQYVIVMALHTSVALVLGISGFYSASKHPVRHEDTLILSDQTRQACARARTSGWFDMG